ncbi:MAG TPA: dioxygenase, partial [Gammaproteobacteria bacterium]|nr:dioxygenase [Gammaproteobacteria bacterium]
RLVHWAEAPGARFCHPREEHLLPLHVCYGVARAPCSDYFELEIMHKKSSMYLW